jgi:hypothetical protein
MPDPVWLVKLSPLITAELEATHVNEDAIDAENVRPTASPLQMVSAEAEVIDGTALLVKTTSSKTTQGPSVTVQRSVADVPAGMPVTADDGEEGTATLAEPEITVHNPVPGEGEFPASVNEPLPHCTWSTPAFAETVDGVIEITAAPSGPQHPLADLALK